jgi:AAHS family 4-hydroxybenzoate transporter-like MFS transporter
MPQAGEVNLTTIIERPHVGWFRISILLWSSLVMAIEGYDMQVAGFAAPAIIKAWKINKALLTPVFGFGLFGYMLGAILLGSLGDHFGRKKIILCGAFWFGALTLAAATSHSVTELFVLRFAAGLGLGAAVPTTIALAMEYAPSRNRAITVAILFIGYNIGAALAGLFAAKFMPVLGWPILFYIGGIAPIALTLALIFVLPESISFLALKQGASPKLARIVVRLDPQLKSAPPTRFILREEKQAGVPVKHLFTEGRAAITILLWCAYVSSLMGQYFLTSWLPTVLAGSGVALSHAVLAGSSVQIGGAVGGLILCRLIDRRGISTLVGSFGLVALLMGLIPYATQSDFALMPLAFLIGFGLMGSVTGLNAVSGTLYPTYIRSTGVGWALGIGRIGSILGPVLGGLLISLNPSNPVLFRCAAVPVLCCAGALYLFSRVPATSSTREAAVSL